MAESLLKTEDSAGRQTAAARGLFINRCECNFYGLTCMQDYRLTLIVSGVLAFYTHAGFRYATRLLLGRHGTLRQ